MNSIKSIDNFLNQENIAVIVVSSNKKSFGTAVYFIERKTDTMSLVNGGKIEDENLYKSLTEIPHKSESVVTVIPLGETEKTIREIYLLVINQVWMQQGSESKSAIKFCVSKGINIIAGKCTIIFAEPVKSIHLSH